MRLRRPSSWRRLQQLVGIGASTGEVFRTESGLWVTAAATQARRVLITEAEQYLDCSAFVRVDHHTQLPADVRRQVVSQLLATLRQRMPLDWGTVVEGWVGQRRHLEMPGWGASFLRYAFAEAIAFDRGRRLNQLIDVFVEANLVRHNIQGRFGLRRAHRILHIGQEIGALLPRDGSSGQSPVDLVDVVANVAHLNPRQRGELLLRLTLAAIGATGVALEWMMVHLAAVSSADPNWRPDARNVAALVAESQRVSPTSWIIVREAATDHDAGGHRVAAGDRFVVLSYALHRAAESWTDPDAFDHSRWVKSPQPQPGSYVPFSAGRSTCPGRNIAVASIVEAAVALAGRYRMSHFAQPAAKPNVRTLFAPPDGELLLTPSR